MTTHPAGRTVAAALDLPPPGLGWRDCGMRPPSRLLPDPCVPSGLRPRFVTLLSLRRSVSVRKDPRSVRRGGIPPEARGIAACAVIRRSAYPAAEF
jgi:hypothetical protein